MSRPKGQEVKSRLGEGTEAECTSPLHRGPRQGCVVFLEEMQAVQVCGMEGKVLS